MIRNLFRKYPLKKAVSIRRFTTHGIETVTPAERVRLFFHHLPKTAGSAFSVYLHTLFPARAICPARTQYGWSDRKSGKYRLFRGHFSPRFIWKHFTPLIWTVFLRDPVKRVISQYENWNDQDRLRDYWKKLLKHHPVAREAVRIAQTSSLEDFLVADNKNVRDVVCNYQTNHLTPRRARDPLWDEQVLADAKQNLLERFVFFGLAEEFEKSMDMFTFQFGLKRTPEAMRRVNVTMHKDKAHVTERALAKIRELNRMDQAMHEFACEEFARRYEMMQACRAAENATKSF